MRWFTEAGSPERGTGAAAINTCNCGKNPGAKGSAFVAVGKTGTNSFGYTFSDKTERIYLPGCVAGGCLDGVTKFYEAVGTVSFKSSSIANIQVVGYVTQYKTWASGRFGENTTIRATIPSNGCMYTTCEPDTIICAPLTTSNLFFRAGGTSFLAFASGRGSRTENMDNWTYKSKTTTHLPVGAWTGDVPLISRSLIGTTSTTRLTFTAKSTATYGTYKTTSKETLQDKYAAPVHFFGFASGSYMDFIAGSSALLPHFPIDAEKLTLVSWSGAKSQTYTTTAQLPPRRTPAAWLATDMGAVRWKSTNARPGDWLKPNSGYEISGSCSTRFTSCVQGDCIECVNASQFNEGKVSWHDVPAFSTSLGSFVFSSLAKNCQPINKIVTYKVALHNENRTFEIRASRGRLEKPFIENKATAVTCVPAFFKVQTAYMNRFGEASVYKHFGLREMTIASGKSTLTLGSKWAINPKNGVLSPFCVLNGKSIYGTLSYLRGTVKAESEDAAVAAHEHWYSPTPDGMTASEAGAMYSEGRGTAILGPLATGESVSCTFSNHEKKPAFGWMLATWKAIKNDRAFTNLHGIENSAWGFDGKSKTLRLAWSDAYSAIFDVSGFVGGRTSLAKGLGMPATGAFGLYDSPAQRAVPAGIMRVLSPETTHFSVAMKETYPDAVSGLGGEPGQTPWLTYHDGNWPR